MKHDLSEELKKHFKRGYELGCSAESKVLRIVKIY